MLLILLMLFREDFFEPMCLVFRSKGLRGLFLLDETQTGTILFFHLLNRKNPAAKISDLGKFLLDCLQPFMPLAVSNLSLCPDPFSKAIFLI
jgi:hypothetical protein